MHGVLRFWMGRGIDGFRIDVMGMVLKHPELADNPPNPAWKQGDHFAREFLWMNNRNFPDVFHAVRGVRAVLDEYEGRTAVGEVFGDAHMLSRYYGGESLDGLPLAFNFQLIDERDNGRYTPWEADTLRRIVSGYEAVLPAGAQPCWALGNHDRPRFVSRNDADGRGGTRARAAAFLLLGLRGTPFLYYGEELGMADVAIPEERQLDPARIHREGRDPERTPMPWDGTPGRGFSTGEPWLPHGPADMNVAAQARDQSSTLSLYRRLLAVRRAEAALHRGGYRELPAAHGVFAFVREADGARPVMVAVNTGLEPAETRLPAGFATVLAASGEEVVVAGDSLVVGPLGAAWVGG